MMTTAQIEQKIKQAQEYLLSPLSCIFWLVVFIRNKLFEKDYFKPVKFSVPIISIGNLTAGGTGKTPVVAALAEALTEAGKKVVIVSRGYKGNYTSEAEKVDIQKSNPTLIYGDEPVWFAKKCLVPVYVGRQRNKAIELCIQLEKPDVIIADDGFQHRWFHRDHNVVLLDVTEDSKLMLPAGRWREPFLSLKRASLVLLTKTNMVSSDALSLWEEKVGDCGFFYKKGNLFKVDYVVDSIMRVHGNKDLKDGDQVMLGSSIARPESFRHLLDGKYKINKHWVFKDHGFWSQLDIDQIEKYASAKRCTHLLVTEKDFVKIQDLDFIDINLWIVRLVLKFTPDKADFLKKLI